MGLSDFAKIFTQTTSVILIAPHLPLLLLMWHPECSFKEFSLCHLFAYKPTWFPIYLE